MGADPSWLALGKGENFLASDVPALLAHTRKVVYLDDNEMAVVSTESRENFRGGGWGSSG